MPRISGSLAALMLAALVAGTGCGGGEKAQQASPEAAPEAPAGKAGHVTVSYYYLPG